MRCYHKILNISYKDHVTNKEVHAMTQHIFGPYEDLLTIEYVAQLVEHQTCTPLKGLIPQCGNRFFSQSTFSADSLMMSIPPCAIAFINICMHIKDPVLHARVWWIKKTLKLETLKHPACTVGWVDDCHSWLSLGKAT